MLAAALLTASTLLTALGEEVPAVALIHFVSSPAGPAWALRARAEVGEPDAAGRRDYRYTVQAWLDAPAADAGPAGGVRQLQRQIEFSAPPPLGGWPERDALGLTWHADGGIELRSGAQPRLKLATGPLQPVVVQPLAQTDCQLAVVTARLTVQDLTRPGVALIELCQRGAARQLEHPGLALLVDSTGRALLAQLVDGRWWQLQPGGPATLLPDPPELTWVDARRSGGWLVPRVWRLSEPGRSALLEAVAPPSPPAGTTPAQAAQLATLLAGPIEAGKQRETLHALVLPIAAPGPVPTPAP